MFSKFYKAGSLILLCLCLSLFREVLYAQNPTTVNSVLEGTVVDEATGLPLEGANIIIEV